MFSILITFLICNVATSPLLPVRCQQLAFSVGKYPDALRGVGARPPCRFVSDIVAVAATNRWLALHTMEFRVFMLRFPRRIVCPQSWSAASH